MVEGTERAGEQVLINAAWSIGGSDKTTLGWASVLPWLLVCVIDDWTHMMMKPPPPSVPVAPEEDSARDGEGRGCQGPSSVQWRKRESSERCKL